MPTTPSLSGGVVSEDTGETEFLPGRFSYQFNSITAQAAFEGNVATMNIRNGTGSDLGAPSLYVVGTDDRRYDGMVEGAAPVADGDQVTLEFTFPEPVNAADDRARDPVVRRRQRRGHGSGAETERLNPADRRGIDSARPRPEGRPPDAPTDPRGARRGARVERARVPRRTGRRRHSRRPRHQEPHDRMGVEDGWIPRRTDRGPPRACRSACGHPSQERRCGLASSGGVMGVRGVCSTARSASLNRDSRAMFEVRRVPEGFSFRIRVADRGDAGTQGGTVGLVVLPSALTTPTSVATGWLALAGCPSRQHEEQVAQAVEVAANLGVGRASASREGHDARSARRIVLRATSSAALAGFAPRHDEDLGERSIGHQLVDARLEPLRHLLRSRARRPPSACARCVRVRRRGRRRRRTAPAAARGSRRPSTGRP